MREGIIDITRFFEMRWVRMGYRNLAWIKDTFLLDIYSKKEGVKRM